MLRVALLMSTLLALAVARIYQRCELARDLLSLGIKREHLATWVCIAYHESRFDTAARNPHSGDHGLLQISELYWCGAGKACGLPCSALRDADISDDVACALRVHEEHTRLQGNGFLAWVVYPQHCKHSAKKYLADCDSLVKTPYLRTEGRARMYKPENLNFTTTSLPYNPKIDELLPPYLTVGSFLRGDYEREFEKNYNKNIRVNWLNFKVNNIDDLKLPNFNKNTGGRYTTLTVTTTTTTTSSPLPKIKPPSPRRIESNSFRRRKMPPIFEADQFSESTNLPISITRISSTNILPSDVITKKYETKKNLMQLTTAPDVPTTTTVSATTTTTTTTITTTTKPLTTTSPTTTTANKITITMAPTKKNVKLSSIESEPVQTTKVPIFYTSATKQTSATQVMSTQNSNERFKTVTERSTQGASLATPSNDPRNATKTQHLTDSDTDIKKNVFTDKSQINRSGVGTSTSNPLSTVGTTKYYSFVSHKSQLPSTTTTTAESRPRSVWRTLPKTTITTTSKPATVRRTTAKSWSSSFSESRFRTEPKLLSSQPPGFNESTTSVPLVRSSTLNTRATLPVTTIKETRVQPTFRFNRVTDRSTSQTTKMIETTSASPTTARTTQSIFDLYLKPTTRPKLQFFSFPSIKNSAFSLRIFAGGTTTHTPSFLTHKLSKTVSGETSKS